DHLAVPPLQTHRAAPPRQRLVGMGVEPFLGGSAIDCIVAQRLARRLCDKCKESYSPDISDLVALGWDEDTSDMPELCRPVGCGVCGKTGYMGRFALHEVLSVSEEIERLIVDHGHSEDIKKVAIAQGMTTLRQAGLL